MFSIDGLQEILYTIKHNKLRTGLTAFGVFWGIFMLILLQGAGKGLLNGVSSRFANDVQDSLWIFPRRTSMPYMGYNANRNIVFTESDMDAIRRQIPIVRHLSSENTTGSFGSSIVVAYGSRTANASVFGVSDQYFDIKSLIEIRHGRPLNRLDQLQGRKIGFIGTRVAEQLLPPGQDPIGQRISINGISIVVGGVFWDKGQQGRMSERIYLPLSTFKNIFGGGDRLGLLTLRPTADSDPYTLADQTAQLLRQRHHIAPEDKRAIWVINIAEQLRETKALFAAIEGFIWFVGFGTLTAGIVGVSNIMLITVRERTREIGVRKALGAGPGAIIGPLLLESVLVTGFAGYFGLVVGVGLIELVAYLFQSLGLRNDLFVNPEVDFRIAITALAVLMSSGLLAGLAPALKAARISPVEAMRADAQ